MSRDLFPQRQFVSFRGSLCPFDRQKSALLKICHYNVLYIVYDRLSDVLVIVFGTGINSIRVIFEPERFDFDQTLHLNQKTVWVQLASHALIAYLF